MTEKKDSKSEDLKMESVKNLNKLESGFFSRNFEFCGLRSFIEHG